MCNNGLFDSVDVVVDSDSVDRVLALDLMRSPMVLVPAPAIWCLLVHHFVPCSMLVCQVESGQSEVNQVPSDGPERMK